MSNDVRQIFGDLKDALFVAARGHRTLFAWSAVLWGVRGALRLCVPIVSAMVIARLQDEFDSTTMTCMLICWIILDVSLGYISDFLDFIFWDWLEPLRLFCRNHLFKQNFKNLLNTPPIVLENQQSSKVISTINSLGEELSGILVQFMRVITRTVAWIGAAIILLQERPLFAGIAFVCWLCAFYTNIKIVKYCSRADELEKRRIQYDAEKTDHMDNMVNINTLQLQDQVINEMDQKLDDYAWFSFRANMKEDMWRSLLLFWDAFPIIVAGLMSAATALQTKDVSRFVLLTGLVSTMSGSGSGVLFYAGVIIKNLKTYRKLCDELKYDHTLNLKLGRGELPAGGSIEMKDVCFCYPHQKEPVLKKLSLKIKQGDRVAIIGNSGMGKSTLINVMQHAYEIQSGEVLINNKNVQKISLKSLKKNITYINQHPTFWRHKTIRENLLMFNPQANEVDFYQALNAANLLEEITHKEKGIDSSVTALSAGQKQRLAMARALLRHTPIIIMDEPTANLDTHAQTKVLQGIKNLSKIKGHKPTVVFASNVPAEIASANRILLLENGKIVEDGNPKKLMDNPNSKVYKRLKKYAALFKGE